MKPISLIAVAFATVSLSACGGGGGQSGTLPGTATANGSPASSPVIGSPTASTPADTPMSAAAVTIIIPAATSTAATVATQTRRTIQYVSPATSVVYISLQNSPGHGNATFSFTERVDATHCSPYNSNGLTCTFSVNVPIGTNTFSILTTGADNVPLGYDSVITTVTAAGPNQLGGQGALSPILAKATAHYAFESIADAAPVPPPAPVVTLTFADAARDAISLSLTGNAPFGDTYSSATVTQSVGTFTLDYVRSGRIQSVSAPEKTATIAAAAAQAFFVETGDGSTSPFTSILTTSTPEVDFTQAEFPQLPAAKLTVPASSSSLTLTCTFATSIPTSDPCPGTAAISIPIF